MRQALIDGIGAGPFDALLAVFAIGLPILCVVLMILGFYGNGLWLRLPGHEPEQKREEVAYSADDAGRESESGG